MSSKARKKKPVPSPLNSVTTTWEPVRLLHPLGKEETTDVPIPKSPSYKQQDTLDHIGIGEIINNIKYDRIIEYIFLYYIDMFGFHVEIEKDKTIEKSIESAIKKYKCHDICKCFQIFVAQPNGFKFNIKDEDIEQYKEFIKSHGFTVYVHARYLDNIFSSAVRPQTLGFVRKEIKYCNLMGVPGFVVHLYRYPPNQVVSSLKTLNPDKNVKIMLETPAINVSDAIYNNPKALHEVYQMCMDEGLNVGIVIDTCHIFASGANISNLDEMKDFFEELIRYIPAECLLIHLNDSDTGVGSGKDRHQSLGKGYIWGKSTEALEWLLKFITKYKLCGILERNEKLSDGGSIAHDLELIKKLNT